MYRLLCIMYHHSGITGTLLQHWASKIDCGEDFNMRAWKMLIKCLIWITSGENSFDSKYITTGCTDIASKNVTLWIFMYIFTSCLHDYIYSISADWGAFIDNILRHLQSEFSIWTVWVFWRNPNMSHCLMWHYLWEFLNILPTVCLFVCL